MLLAPFALAETPRAIPARSHRRRVDTRATPVVRRVPPWLVVWAVLGTLAVVIVPALRGGGLLGATVPFWLVAAPLINVAWLTRQRWIAAAKRRLR